MGDPNMAPMTEKARSNLIRHRQSIVEDLDVEHISAKLIANSAVTNDDVELIESKVTRRRRAVTFLNILGTKGQHAYNSTHAALLEGQPHLALFLEDAVTGAGQLVKGASVDGFTKAQANVMLRKGGVPVPPPVFTSRPEQIKAIQDALKQLKEDPGWTVVHGMGGIGKSVLAAAAIRDPDILSDYFPGGLYWMTIGNIDKTKLLSKVQTLCARLEGDQDRTPPHNLDEGKDRLRNLFQDKHPRSLLILDDVWSTKVISAFDVQARVMVTTRDKGVTERVSGRVYRVQLEKGFSEAQAMEALAAWTLKKPEDLPSEAKEIFMASKGSPLVISIIGALLADHPNRWKYYLEKLMQKRFNSLKKVTAYEYGSVGEAMGMSLEQLSDELRDIYASFAIFGEDVPIPATVLGIMHSKEQETIEDLMEEIINKSLAFQEWNSTSKCMTYTLHDLQLDFLIENYKDKLENMNKKLTQCFKKHCNGEYHKLEDDGYIFTYLAKHMVDGKEFAELSKLLRSIQWIIKKVGLLGPANVLSDYVSHKDFVPAQDKVSVGHFQSFVSVNAHLLMTTPLPDILQLALLQADSTEVCQQARALIKAKDGGFYVEWCNKYLVQDHLLMTNTPHDGVTNSAHFTQNGDQIISCGEDGKVKLWGSQSGKEVCSFEAHDDWINWCEISPDGALIVTCTSASVNLWRRHDLSLEMKISGDWLRAIISHDGNKIAMYSMDGIIEVLDRKADRRVHIRAHEGVVRSICFTPDDEHIVSCSDDMAVKVFRSPTGVKVRTYSEHPANVLNCSCSPDGREVASAGRGLEGGSEIHVWELATGKQSGRCESEADSILCCEFSPKGDVIAGGLSSFEILLWETRRYKPVAVFKGHTSWVMSVKFDVKGERLVSASDDETVRTWKVEYGHRDLKSVWKRDFTTCFCGGTKRVKFVIAGDNDNRCLMTDGRDMEKTSMLTEEARRMRAFALNSDNSKVAVGSDGGKVKLINVESKTIERSLDAHAKEVRQCALTGDGTLITCSNDGLLKIWPEGKDPIICQGHEQAITKFHLFKNETRILTASLDGTLKVWEFPSGHCLETIEAHSDWIFTCQVSPDHKVAASGSVDRKAKVWDLETLKELKSLDSHCDTVRMCRFSPDNRLLGTGDDSGYTIIWDVASGEEIGTCKQHKSWVTDIKFSPDSKIVVTCGENVRWWQIDGTPLQTFHVRGSFIRQVQVSQDFRTFVTIDSAGILYLMCKVELCNQELNHSEVLYV